MKAILFGFAALTLALMPTAPVAAATPEPVPAAANGAHDPYAHGWYVHYHRDHRGHAHHHVAGPFSCRHDAEDHAHHLEHDGFHIDRIVRN